MRKMLVVLVVVACFLAGIFSTAQAVDTRRIPTNDGVVYQGEFPDSLEGADWKYEDEVGNVRYFIKIKVAGLTAIQAVNLHFLVEDHDLPGLYKTVNNVAKIDLRNRFIWVQIGDEDVEEGRPPRQEMFGVFMLSIPDIKPFLKK